MPKTITPDDIPTESFPTTLATSDFPAQELTATDPSPRKIFVLDTSVILHDHQALHSFEEHDVAIPLTVLEELDRFKKGSSVLNRNAREFIRGLDQLSGDNLLQEWIPLNGDSSGKIRVLPPPNVTTPLAHQMVGDAATNNSGPDHNHPGMAGYGFVF